jgi:hypothetical protein
MVDLERVVVAELVDADLLGPPVPSRFASVTVWYAATGTAASESFWSVSVSSPRLCTGFGTNTEAVPVRSCARRDADEDGASRQLNRADEKYPPQNRCPPLSLAGRSLSGGLRRSPARLS